MHNKENHKSSFPSLLLITVIFFTSSLIALFLNIPISRITTNFNYSVIIILITMELFTNLIIETGIMQYIAIKLSLFSKANKKVCIILFGLLMFFVSMVLNNITAVLITLPVILALLKVLDIDKLYIAKFFCVILALSNTGGAASPIGDFPAIVIMTSGITNFTGYLFRALPLFLITSIIILFIWSFNIKDKKNLKKSQLLAIDLLQSRYKNLTVRKDVLVPLGIILLLMFIAWSVIPQTVIPSEIIALLGYCLGMVVASNKGIKVTQMIDMKSILTISSFLFFSTVISETEVLNKIVEIIEPSIQNPKIFLIVIMIISSLISGLVSAGPASAAMMPIIVNLCNSTFSSCSDWVAIAYAASICAGSSMFLWSATAGFILSEKFNASCIECNGKKQTWGVVQYLKYGLVNYSVQMIVAIIFILIVI